MSLDKIKENHERFTKENEAIEKLKIASKNTVIQFKAATKAMNELKYIADSLGYKVDEDNGELRCSNNMPKSPEWR